MESLEGLVRLAEVHRPHGQDSEWLCKTDWILKTHIWDSCLESSVQKSRWLNKAGGGSELSVWDLGRVIKPGRNLQVNVWVSIILSKPVEVCMPEFKNEETSAVSRSEASGGNSGKFRKVGGSSEASFWDSWWLSEVGRTLEVHFNIQEPC